MEENIYLKEYKFNYFLSLCIIQITFFVFLEIFSYFILYYFYKKNNEGI